MKNKLKTFGDSREIMLDALVDLKNRSISPDRARAMADCLDVVNDNMRVEIEAAKMSIVAASIQKDFGDIMRLGQRKMFDDQLMITAESGE